MLRHGIPAGRIESDLQDSSEIDAGLQQLRSNEPDFQFLPIKVREAAAIAMRGRFAPALQLGDGGIGTWGTPGRDLGDFDANLELDLPP